MYAAQPAPANSIVAIAAADGKKLNAVPLKNPRAVFVDRTNRALLYALHGEKNAWTVSSIALKDGVPAGEWKAVFTLPDIGTPDDCDTDSKGAFYVTSAADNRVYKFNESGDHRPVGERGENEQRHPRSKQLPPPRPSRGLEGQGEPGSDHRRRARRGAANQRKVCRRQVNSLVVPVPYRCPRVLRRPGRARTHFRG